MFVIVFLWQLAFETNAWGNTAVSNALERIEKLLNKQ